MDLPQKLRSAIDSELESLSAKNLSTSVTNLSKRYRTGRSAGKGKFLKSREDITAYAAFRLPATFAAVYSALSQVKERLPNWNPQTLLDVGAGPGTVMWAAGDTWPGLREISLLEREQDMITLGKKLAAHSSLGSIQEAEWTKTDITGSWNASRHDLVTASYVLGELPEASGLKLINKLWEITDGTLVIIEPGTPEGFSRIKKVRELLLNEGAHTIAPCPHDKPCPMADNDWCHFSQRVSRSRIHRQVKAGELAYEDEKFSFVSLSRMNGENVQGRVIRHPQVRKGHIRMDICTTEGLKNTVVTRKNKEQFRQARNLSWGSTIPEKFDDH